MYGNAKDERNAYTRMDVKESRGEARECGLTIQGNRDGTCDRSSERGR